MRWSTCDIAGGAPPEHHPRRQAACARAGSGPPAPKPRGRRAGGTRRRAELRERGTWRDECDAERHAYRQHQTIVLQHVYVLRSRGLVGRRWLPPRSPATGKRSGAAAASIDDRFSGGGRRSCDWRAARAASKESRGRTSSTSGRRCGRCGHPGCSPARRRSAGRDQA